MPPSRQPDVMRNSSTPTQPRSLWRHPEFLKLWGGQTFSAFGSLISGITLPFLVIYTLHATPAQVAWVRTAEIAPGMLVGLFAGVWIDRLRRKPIMIWADVMRALLIGSIPMAFWLGHLTLPQILVVGALVSILTVSFDVSYETYLPTLVGPEQVLEANAKLSATGSIVEVAGFGIAGMLFQLIGGALTLAIDAVSFVVSVVTLAWIRKPEPAPTAPEAEESVLRAAAAGLRTVAQNPLLLALTGSGSLASIFDGAMGTLYVLYVSRQLQIAPGVQGILYATGGISSFVGAAIAGRVLRRFGLGPTLGLASFFGLIAIALVPAAFGPYWLILAMLISQQLLGDVSETVYKINVTSLRQVVVPNALLGRVNATWRVANWLFVLGGTLGAGLLAEKLGLQTTFFLAVGVRGLASLWLVLSPVRRIRAMPAAAAGAAAET